MELFYTTHISGESAIFPEEESYHCIKILRKKVSDLVYFTDGNGAFYKGTIRKADLKKCELEIVEKENREAKAYHLHIAIAPTKNIDRTEFFVEKAVEIGINEITFLRCERSERKEVKVERLQKIAISAMKQSKKAYLPGIQSMVSYKEFINKNISVREKYIASLGQGEFRKLKDILAEKSSYLILIGPEGDFSPTEVDLAIKKGFSPLSLGESVLRTETAGIYACMFLDAIHQLKA